MSRRRTRQEEDHILRGAAILKAQIMAPTNISDFSDPFAAERQEKPKIIQHHHSDELLSVDIRSFGEYIEDQVQDEGAFYDLESFGENELENYCGEVVEKSSIYDDDNDDDLEELIQQHETSYTFDDGAQMVVISPDGSCCERRQERGSGDTTSSSSTNSDPLVLSSREMGRLKQELQGLGTAKHKKGCFLPEALTRKSTRRSNTNEPRQHAHRMRQEPVTPQGIKEQQQHCLSQRHLYKKLLNDPAYGHAAGFLWQSLIGQHMKLPGIWWDGRRGPNLGSSEDRPWMYVSRDTVKNPVLRQLVRGRASAGRILLHIVVQDILTRTTLQDIAVGCFHPNAKGIRETEHALARFEDYRDVWVAVRKHSDAVSAVESTLLFNLSQPKCRSPLGPGRRVDNTNVRATFGERPPLETLRMTEDEVYERVAFRMTRDSLPPAVAILQEFVFA